MVLKAHARSDLGDDESGIPDARALDRIGIETALRHRLLPLTPAGAVTPVACPSFSAFKRMEPHLRTLLGDVACRIRSAEVIEDQILTLRKAYLARRAEIRTPSVESCRGWSGNRLALVAIIIGILIALCAVWAPNLVLAALVGWSALTLLAVTGLRGAAAITQVRHARREGKLWSSRRPQLAGTRMPRISVLVPLFDERDIAARLIRRLSRLEYPRDRLEVCLILESGDFRTETALRGANLPPWMRIVHVPRGHLRTKPRAMNYALDFTDGDIVGVYDAEDAPAPDQLLKIVEAFGKAPPDVACLQGVLDFYNARQSWLTRCFTIDYAIWFRLVLPGLVRLGLPIPLGGTTVFFRRTALEALGRWDAHNVTEDADLGLRLTRRGFRCAFVPTVTEEEATATVAAWVRQRSRWIKGYAITWAVHMRDPLRLLGELGALRFLGVQILFLGTLSQFLLAPLLWSFWLIVFGFDHPATTFLPWSAIVFLGTLFLASEVATIAMGALAVAAPKHSWLIKWVPLMHLYFPLASIASWKGFGELIWRPFYWDKTGHGRVPDKHVRP